MYFLGMMCIFFGWYVFFWMICMLLDNNCKLLTPERLLGQHLLQKLFAWWKCKSQCYICNSRKQQIESCIQGGGYKRMLCWKSAKGQKLLSNTTLQKQSHKFCPWYFIIFWGPFKISSVNLWNQKVFISGLVVLTHYIKTPMACCSVLKHQPLEATEKTLSRYLVVKGSTYNHVENIRATDRHLIYRLFSLVECRPWIRGVDDSRVDIRLAN